MDGFKVGFDREKVAGISFLAWLLFLPTSFRNERINLVLNEGLLAGDELVPVTVENGRCGEVPEFLTGEFAARLLAANGNAG